MFCKFVYICIYAYSYSYGHSNISALCIYTNVQCDVLFFYIRTKLVFELF